MTIPTHIPNHIPTYIVDSFTTEKFKGNPAGVCLPTEPLTDKQMLNIANELGFSETAFVSPPPCEGGVRRGSNCTPTNKHKSHYQIRFFSPSQEIDLCGHATLATAKILFHTGKAEGLIHFKNINDVSLIVQQDKHSDKLLMEFPAYQVEQISRQAIPTAMLQALGIDLDNDLGNEVVNTGYNQAIRSFVIEINRCHTLANLTPNFEQLLASCTDFNGMSIDGVVITSLSDKDEYDFESRYFWPWAGTNEDPVTGAIHTFLATYWGQKLGKTKMNALQCSARSGSMQVELTKRDTVILTGEAQIVLEGRLDLH